MIDAFAELKKNTPTSTVGRGRTVTLTTKPEVARWMDDDVTLCLGDSLDHYASWATPQVIVSDGAYGILGFEGDTSNHLGIAEDFCSIFKRVSSNFHDILRICKITDNISHSTGMNQAYSHYL